MAPSSGPALRSFPDLLASEFGWRRPGRGGPGGTRQHDESNVSQALDARGQELMILPSTKIFDRGKSDRFKAMMQRLAHAAGVAVHTAPVDATGHQYSDVRGFALARDYAPSNARWDTYEPYGQEGTSAFTTDVLTRLWPIDEPVLIHLRRFVAADDSRARDRVDATLDRAQLTDVDSGRKQPQQLHRVAGRRRSGHLHVALPITDDGQLAFAYPKPGDTRAQPEGRSPKPSARPASTPIARLSSSPSRWRETNARTSLNRFRKWSWSSERPPRSPSRARPGLGCRHPTVAGAGLRRPAGGVGEGRAPSAAAHRHAADGQRHRRRVDVGVVDVRLDPAGPAVAVAGDGGWRPLLRARSHMRRTSARWSAVRYT